MMPIDSDPIHKVAPVIPNQLNNQYAMIESTTGAVINRAMMPFDSCLLRPICQVEMLAGMPTNNSRTTASISRFIPPHYLAYR